MRKYFTYLFKKKSHDIASTTGSSEVPQTKQVCDAIHKACLPAKRGNPTLVPATVRVLALEWSHLLVVFIYLYIYIYTHNKHTHTHTHIYIYVLCMYTYDMWPVLVYRYVHLYIHVTFSIFLVALFRSHSCVPRSTAESQGATELSEEVLMAVVGKAMEDVPAWFLAWTF